MNPFSVIGHQSLGAWLQSLVICHLSLPEPTRLTPMRIRHFPGQCPRRTHFVNMTQHQKQMTDDEWQMTNDGGRMTGMREGGTFEALSLFIVHRSFGVVEWRSPGYDK
jgi:hypothetical protein